MASLDEIRNALWNDEFDGREDATEYVLEQYKLCIEMADRIGQRRGAANTSFLTVNTNLEGALAGFYDTPPPLITASVYAAAIVLSITWWVLLRSYRNLNSAKFKVIGVLEERLPAHPYFRAEWKALDEGKDWRTYIPLSKAESVVPVAFIVIYVYLFFSTLSV